MATVNATELASIQAAHDKAVELQNLVRGSLSIQAVGGSVIANDLTGVIAKLKGIIDTATVV